MLQTLLPAAETEEHSVLFPALPEIVWSFIVLVILFTVIMKLMYPRYVELMTQRAQQIKAGLEKAQQADQQVKQADDQAAQAIRAAQEEAAELRSEAQENAKKIIAEAKEQASKEAERILAVAKGQIEVERKAAQSLLQAQVGALATDLAEKIVGEHLQDQALSARVIDRFLDQLEDSSSAELATEGVRS